MAKRKQSCKKNGYHDWVVDGVIGIVPDEQVELSCSRCDAQGIADVNIISDGDD